MCPTPFESLRCEVSHDIITLMHQSEGSTCEMSLPAFAAAAKKRPVNHTGRVRNVLIHFSTKDGLRDTGTLRVLQHLQL